MSHTEQDDDWLQDGPDIIQYLDKDDMIVEPGDHPYIESEDGRLDIPWRAFFSFIAAILLVGILYTSSFEVIDMAIGLIIMCLSGGLAHSIAFHLFTGFSVGGVLALVVLILWILRKARRATPTVAASMGIASLAAIAGVSISVETIQNLLPSDAQSTTTTYATTAAAIVFLVAGLFGLAWVYWHGTFEGTRPQSVLKFVLAYFVGGPLIARAFYLKRGVQSAVWQWMFAALSSPNETYRPNGWEWLAHAACVVALAAFAVPLDNMRECKRGIDKFIYQMGRLSEAKPQTFVNNKLTEEEYRQVCSETTERELEALREYIKSHPEIQDKLSGPEVRRTVGQFAKGGHHVRGKRGFVYYATWACIWSVVAALCAAFVMNFDRDVWNFVFDFTWFYLGVAWELATDFAHALVPNTPCLLCNL